MKNKRPELEAKILKIVHNFGKAMYEKGEEHEAMLFGYATYTTKKILEAIASPTQEE